MPAAGAAKYTGHWAPMSDLTTATAKPLLVIAGPTGSGKSALAIRLAAEVGGEIVNADSVQLYRGLQIGSAKTPPHAREGIPHHLLDLLEPWEVPTAGDWAALAVEAIAGIWGRGALPIVTGGTGFYIRALLEGITESPTRDDALRARLAAIESSRPGFLHRALRRFDPASARRIHPNDINKALRALEICILAGAPASRVFATAPRKRLEGYRGLYLVLNPARQVLLARIAERTRAMFAAGLLEEVRALLKAGVAENAKAFESIGYKESLDLLGGRLTEGEAIEAVIIATRQYAKRQATWFRREKNCFWINDFGESQPAFEQALRLIRHQFALDTRFRSNFSARHP